MNSADVNLANESLIRQCSIAADRNTQLFCQLLDVVATENLCAGTLDYHHAFNAAVILELARLLDRNTISAFQNKVQVQFTANTLQSAAQRGLAFTQDCFVVLMNLHNFVEELLRALSRLGQNTSVKSPDQQRSLLGVSPLRDLGEQTGLDVGFAAGDFTFEHDEAFSEFMSWVDDRIL